MRAFGLLVVSGALVVAGTAAEAQRFDPSPAWPLCGRIVDNRPHGWTVFDGCPIERWGSADHTDEPLSSTFGPRQKASERFRYDYHRGIDIPTPVDTPVFAIASGRVVLAGLYPAYEDVVVQLRHYRPNRTSCTKSGCYYSNYLHLSRVVVAEGEWVRKGELIGFTGTSVSGFEHLHFEVRDAPWFDPLSNWQRDAVHPLRVLRYRDVSTPVISFDRVDTSDPARPVVGVSVSSEGLDIVRVELVVYGDQLEPVAQPGNVVSARGYNVAPSWLDFEEWNFQYSHKDTGIWSWSRFSAGGGFECPYHEAHGAAYSPHVHLDRAVAGRASVGAFNGVVIAPGRYSTATERYTLRLIFEELAGPARCIEAYVEDVDGNVYRQVWGRCWKPPSTLFRLLRPAPLGLPADRS